jgi:hypothetical protein
VNQISVNYLTPQYVQGVRLSHRVSQDLSQNDYPKYKFYTGLLYQMSDFRREFGSDFSEGLWSLRKGLQRDALLEKKLFDCKGQAFFQFLVVMLMSWGFIISAHHILEIEIHKKVCLLLLLVQTLGFFLYLLFEKRMLGKLLGFHCLFIESILVLNPLLKTGLSLRKVMARAQVERLNCELPRRFRPIAQQLTALLEKLKNSGEDISDPLQLLIDEVWFLQEGDLEKAQRYLQGLRLLIIPIFFLLGHFAYIFWVFGALFTS